MRKGEVLVLAIWKVELLALTPHKHHARVEVPPKFMQITPPILSVVAKLNEFSSCNVLVTPFKTARHSLHTKQAHSSTKPLPGM